MPDSPASRFLILAADRTMGGWLQRRLAPYRAHGVTISLAEPGAVHQDALLNGTDAVFIPGARTSERFNTQVGESGYVRLREYANAGGVIIGICKGFYLLSRRICYTSADGREKIETDKTLDLLPGTASGDLLPRINPGATSTGGWSLAAVTPLSVSLPNLSCTRQINALYWSGPLFKPDPDDRRELQFPGTYTAPGLDWPAYAVALRRVGHGAALGIGPHLEIGSDTLLDPTMSALDTDDGSHRHSLAAQLEPDDTARTAFFFHLIDRALSLRNQAPRPPQPS